MALSVKHAKVLAIADGPDDTVVRPSDWNAALNVKQAADRILGRVSAGEGDTEELTAAQVKTLLALATVATSGAYGDLTGKPTLGSLAAKNQAAMADLAATGTPDNTTYLRGDGTWTTPPSAPVTSVNGSTGAVTLTQDTVGDGTTYKQYSQTEKTKLAGIASGATANSSDATLLARANHTGTQSADTLTDGSTNKAYTGTEQTKLAGITAGADPTGATIHSATSKTTPIDADELGLIDTAASNALKRLTWANVKATLKSYFDTLYALAAHSHAWADITSGKPTTLSGYGITDAIANSLLTTRGDIITRGASAPQRLALGTSGYFLKSDGTDAVWAAPSSGSLVFISEQSASNSATIEFNSGINSTYNSYEIHLHSVIPATEGQLRMRTSTNGGSSFDSGASDYQYILDTGVAGTGTASVTQSSGIGQIPLSQATTNGIGNAAGEAGLSGVIRIYKPSGTNYCLFYINVAYIDASGLVRHFTGGAARTSAADVDAIQFIMASGNITSGHFALYGIAD